MNKIAILLLSFFVFASASGNNNFNKKRDNISSYLKTEIDKGMDPSKFSNAWFKNNWLQRLYTCCDLVKKNKNYDSEMRDCINMFNDIKEHIGSDNDRKSIRALDSIKVFNAFFNSKKEIYIKEVKDERERKRESRKEDNFNFIQSYASKNDFFITEFIYDCEQSLKKQPQTKAEKTLRYDCRELLNALIQHRTLQNNSIITKCFGDGIRDRFNEIKNEFKYFAPQEGHSIEYAPYYWKNLEKTEQDFRHPRIKHPNQFFKENVNKTIQEYKKKCEKIFFDKDKSFNKDTFTDCENFLKKADTAIKNNRSYIEYWLGSKTVSLNMIKKLEDIVVHEKRQYLIKQIEEETKKLTEDN